MRVLLLVAMLLGLSSAGWVPALADPQAPVDACVVSDKRITELSGLASDGTHWYAHNDGGTKIVVFVLNKKCAVEKTITAPLDPYDVEDMARAPDGTLWLSDTGDNDSKRATVAVTELTPDGKTTLHRLTFPDGAHDTEALLLDRGGVPYLITKNPLGIAGIYRPTGPLATPGPTPLEKVGELHLSSTSTQGGPVPSIVGSVLVTGAASNADGSVVAVRTYTDAYLFAVPPSGDLVAALGGTPVRVPLPNEKQGEALAFEPDGTLLSGSEGAGQPIRMVPGAAALVTAQPPAKDVRQGQPAQPSAPASAPAATQTHRDGLPTMPAIGVTVGVMVLVLLYLRRRKAR